MKILDKDSCLKEDILFKKLFNYYSVLILGVDLLPRLLIIEFFPFHFGWATPNEASDIMKWVLKFVSSIKEFMV